MGFLCTALILIKNKRKSDSLVNKYLIAITENVALRFLLYWIAASYPTVHINKVISVMDVNFILLIPCYYLYFQNIIYEKKFELSNLFHFVLPLLLGVFFVLNRFISPELIGVFLKLFLGITFLFYIFCAIISFVMLYKHVWRRKTYIKIIQKQNDQIKNWCLFLYFSFVLIFIIRLVNGILYYKFGNISNHNLWMPAFGMDPYFCKNYLES